MDDVVYKINVSGKIYHVKYKILKQIPFFLNFLDEGKEYDVERSPMIFDHVLAYVIDPRHPFPSKYFYELDFYGLTYKKDIYKVNVLGKIYHIKCDILMKIPYFVKRINDINHGENSLMNSSVDIFVERSSLLFEQILAYVMNDEYPIDCYDELDYYGIIYKRYNLNKTDLCLVKNSMKIETDKILSKLGYMNDDITKIHEKLDNIERPGHKKPCTNAECDKYIEDEGNTNYCDDHSECKRCYNKANRHDNYLCYIHKK